MTLADAYNLPTEYQSGVNRYPLNLRSILAALFLPPFILRLLVIDVAAASFIQAFVAFLVVGSTMGCLQKFLCSFIFSNGLLSRIVARDDTLEDAARTFVHS